MRAILAAVLAALLALSPVLGAWAKEAVPTITDPVRQKRAIALEESLRCLVCQNQTIADSSADLAKDLRRQVREQMAQGRSDKEIVAYMVQRYGDFVLYKPPVKATTLLLWFGPLLLLFAGAFALWRHVRLRGRRAAPPPLSEEELARAHALLGDAAGDSGK